MTRTLKDSELRNLSAGEIGRQFGFSEYLVCEMARQGILPAMNAEKTKFDWFDCATALQRIASMKTFQSLRVKKK